MRDPVSEWTSSLQDREDRLLSFGPPRLWGLRGQRRQTNPWNRVSHGTRRPPPALLRPEPPAGVPDGFRVAAHHAVTAEPCALPSQVLAAAGPSLAATSPGTHAPLPLAT